MNSAVKEILEILQKNRLLLLFFGLLIAAILFRNYPTAIEQAEPVSAILKIMEEAPDEMKLKPLFSGLSNHVFLKGYYGSIQLSFSIPLVIFFLFWTIGLLETTLILKPRKRKSVTLLFLLFHLLSWFLVLKIELDDNSYEDEFISFYLGSGLVAYWILTIAVQLIRKHLQKSVTLTESS